MARIAVKEVALADLAGQFRQAIAPFERLEAAVRRVADATRALEAAEAELARAEAAAQAAKVEADAIREQMLLAGVELVED